MDANDDIYVKGTHFNCIQMHTIFEQIYPKPAIVALLVIRVKKCRV